MDPTTRHVRWARRAGAAALVLSALALCWPMWLEGWIGESADHGDGTVEYALAVGVALAASALLIVPALAVRRARRAPLEARDGR